MWTAGAHTRRSLMALPVALVCMTVAVTAQTTQPPTDWLDTNIGNATGSWSYGDNGFFVEGTGTDIWDTADSFHFTYQQINDDTEFRARILDVSGTEAWTKVGLMIRESLDPSAAHHFLLASEGKGLAYQRRPTSGGTSVSTSLGTGSGPVWFRIVRTQGVVQLGMSSDGVNWTSVATLSWPTGPTYIGFAVTSHGSNVPAQGTFDHVALSAPSGRTPPDVTISLPAQNETVPAGQPYAIRWIASDVDNDIVQFDAYSGKEGTDGVTFYESIPGCTGVAGSLRECTWQNPNPPGDHMHVLVIATDQFNNEGRAVSGTLTIGATSGGLPSGWSSTDVGAVSAAGSASYANGVFTVNGSGADIWGTADEFHFAHQLLSGDFIITARVASVEAVSTWTKAGLMVREGLQAGARHASLFATPSTTKGVAYQRRLTTDGLSTSTAGPAFAPPVWLKISRRGPGISTYYRHSITDPWKQLAYEVLDNLADTVEVGLAVSSHSDGTLATAQFTNVTIEPMQPWRTAAIASTQGEASYDGVIFGLYGQGSDIWGTADSMYYTYIPWTGDGTITARVRDIDPSDAWAKAGVMFRESLTPGSRHVFALLSYGKGAALQYRPTTNGTSAAAASASGAAPGWIRLTRSGDTFTSQLSFDGTTWQTLGTVTVPMAQAIYVGIAHTTHDPTAHLGARFDDLSVNR